MTLFHMKQNRPCCRCKREHDGKGKYCRPCHAEYMRAWRASRRKQLDELIEAVKRLAA